MFKKVVKEKQYSSRIEIIHENFFRYLKINNITQKKYSIDNNVAMSTISKWKNNTSCMNEEHIIQAAKYFQISVNQLFYTEQELKELKVKNDKTYDPIMAQHNVSIKLFDKELIKPSSTILYQLVVSILLVLIMAVTKNGFAQKYLIFLIIPVVAVIHSIKFGRKETFNINYLDDIFYKIDDINNKHFLVNVILNILEIMIVIILMILILILPIRNTDSMILAMVFFLAIITLVFLFISLLNNQRKMDEEIYEVFYNYLLCFYLSFHFSLMLAGACVSIAILDFISNWPLLFVLILPILSYIQYSLTSKKYSEYKIVYYEHKTDSNRVLFEE